MSNIKNVNDLIANASLFFPQQRDGLLQFTVTEGNEWEGETYGYIIFITQNQADFIQDKINQFDIGHYLDIKQTNYSLYDVSVINKHSSNSYMSRLAFYEFFEEETLNNWKEQDDVFYKGTGLKVTNDGEQIYYC